MVAPSTRDAVNPPRPSHLLLVLLGLSAFSSTAASIKVQSTPNQPKSGELVNITARFKPPFPDGVALQYQLVDPGRYIALADPAFQTNWVSWPMRDDGMDGDARRGDGVFTASLPGRLQVHRRLVRYRIVTAGRVLAPDHDDSVPNHAYFVYDGIPPWHGAVNPQGATAALREVHTFGTNIMRSVPAYHLIATKTAVENTAWYQPVPWENKTARKAYQHTGTFIGDDGQVYDHVGFRARGGSWRYAMGKTMWKFDFNPGHHFTARDNFGEPYRVKWDKVNLGACIQHADYGRRGEHGMYEAVGFRVFNLADVEAPRTHWVQLRIIDEAGETSASQYGGDFWGLYLAMENLDDAFLKEHDLPPGNLYKMEFGVPDLHTRSPHAGSADAAVRQFIAGYQRPQPESWWRTHLDLPRYYSYRSLIECLHHYDVYTGKNYFYYHNPRDQRWRVLPWDIDHSWGDRMHGNGMEPFMVLGLTARPPFQIEYQNRLREIRDLLFNPEQMDPLIDGHAAIISDARDGLSFVDADRAMWDYNPIMAARFLSQNKAGHGWYYRESPTGDFRGMVRMMKDYVRTRGAWVDETLLRDPAIPPTPRIARDGALFRAVVPGGSAAEPKIHWRLAEITPGASQPRQGTKYEITALWQTNGTVTAQLPNGIIEAGRTYRVRARLEGAGGRYGHWSVPVEFGAPQ